MVHSTRVQQQHEPNQSEYPANRPPEFMQQDPHSTWKCRQLKEAPQPSPRPLDQD